MHEDVGLVQCLPVPIPLPYEKGDMLASYHSFSAPDPPGTDLFMTLDGASMRSRLKQNPSKAPPKMMTCEQTDQRRHLTEF
jgi:hypothetical protein